MSSVGLILGEQVRNMMVGIAFALAVGGLVLGIYNCLRNTNVYTLNNPPSGFAMTSPQCNKRVAVVQPSSGTTPTLKLPSCPKNAWIEFFTGNQVLGPSYVDIDLQQPDGSVSVTDNTIQSTSTTLSTTKIVTCSQTPNALGNYSWACNSTNQKP